MSLKSFSIMPSAAIVDVHNYAGMTSHGGSCKLLPILLPVELHVINLELNFMQTSRPQRANNMLDVLL